MFPWLHLSLCLAGTNGINWVSCSLLPRPEPGVSKLLMSLGHPGRRRVVLGHTLNTQTLRKTKKSHNVLSNFTIWCWATFIAILGPMWPVGTGWMPPKAIYSLVMEERYELFAFKCPWLGEIRSCDVLVGCEVAQTVLPCLIFLSQFHHSAFPGIFSASYYPVTLTAPIILFLFPTTSQVHYKSV